MSIISRALVRGLSVFDGWRHRAREKSDAPHLVLARRGEDIAHRFAQLELGWRVLSRNFRDPGRHAEIDLVALDGDTLVIAEVKTRSNADESHPLRAVDTAKMRRIGHGARLWLEKAEQMKLSVRFDVLTVVLAEGDQYRVEYFRDAFFPAARPGV